MYCLQLAEAAKAQFSRDYSDHLAIVRAYEGWKDAEIDFAGYEYCWKNFLSVQSMKAIDALRRDFFSLLRDTSLVDGNTTTSNQWSHDKHLIRAVICYGLYPGISSVVVSQRSLCNNFFVLPPFILTVASKLIYQNRKQTWASFLYSIAITSCVLVILC